MPFFDLVEKRFSVRAYEEKTVEKSKIEKILAAARLAPSAVNFQPCHFIVIDEPELKAKITAAYRRDWLKTAPVIIVACGDHSQSWKRRDGKDHCDIDVAIAVDHLTLAAASLGLGTCWVCAFDAKKVHDVLNLPENLEPIALVPLGYPAEERGKKERKALGELVSWNGYNRDL
ncbi:MAG TPA: nitroreductase [Firmicutes bacterium]|nr:nitroreductase [Bacillota bacterium]